MKRHSTDLVSLTFGLIFAAIAGWWLVGHYVHDLNIRVPNLGLIIAGGLILLGLLGAIGSLRRDRRTENRDTYDDPAPAPAAPTVMAGMPTVGDPRTMPTIITNPYLTTPDRDDDRQPAPRPGTFDSEADTEVRPRAATDDAPSDPSDDPTPYDPTRHEATRHDPTPYDAAAYDTTQHDAERHDPTTDDAANRGSDTEPGESVDPAAPSERDNRPS